MIEIYLKNMIELYLLYDEENLKSFGEFYLVSKVFYDQENRISDESTIQSCDDMNEISGQIKEYERDLYGHNYTKTVIIDGKSVKVFMEEAESSHSVDLSSGISLTPKKLVDALNETFTLFKITKIINPEDWE